MLAAVSRVGTRLRSCSQIQGLRTPMIIKLSQRPFNWKAEAPAGPPGAVTFPSNLSKLPVPELQNTLTRLKESLAPISWSEAEYAAVEKKINEFAANQGPELQQRLMNHAEGQAHWLEKWWDDGAYLSYRDSVIINVSYYYGFDAHPAHLKQTPAARAAGLARAAMFFRRSVKQGTLPPEATKEGPLCMDTYRWMFDCCRIPGPQGLDWSVTYAKEGEDGSSGHIVVFRKNRVWKVEVISQGRLLSTDEIERQIQYIYDNTIDTHPGVGVLTASGRDTWAKDYSELARSAHNSSILHTIQSAAFVLNLDSSKPSSFVHHSRALWHGDVSNGIATGLENRWVDKPVQFIVFDNCVAGILGEHSVMDGTPTVRLCDDVLDMLADPKFDHGVPSVSPGPVPTPLDWEITPTITKAIEEANKAATKSIEGHELGYLRTLYGKAAIKRFGFSPDAWTQMIIQLAYRRLIGGANRIGGTYEAATTRRFFKGRTEAIRVVTNESDNWVRSMDDKRSSKEERRRLFAVAVEKHISLAQAAGMGQGVDRHILGLKKVLQQGEPIPTLFTDPVFIRSSYWALSTSAVFSKHFDVYGWGEVVPDGFGVAYMTGFDDYLQYTVTSRKEMPNAEFCQELSRAALDLYDLYADDVKSRL